MFIRLTALCASLALLAGCPSADPTPSDAGPTGTDAGFTFTACTAPQDCPNAGAQGVCRDGACRPDVPCEDDVECSLGEACRGTVCRFVGCTKAEDCATGRCELERYSCAECGTNAECPADRPVCGPSGQCLSCATDSQCQPPGPGYCDAPSGTCVHCTADTHCPSGLSCQAGVCVGAGENESCTGGIRCAKDLLCVNVGQNVTQCRRACNLYTPACPSGQLCLKVTAGSTPSLVFEQGAPLGICSAPLNGLKFYKEACGPTQVCQPNLACVQDSVTASSCKAFCDPAAPACQPGELCHSYPGDYSGRQYGLCYPDNGVGQACTAEAQCRPGMSCGPVPDPSTFTDVSAACRFAATTASSGLAPCTADADCKSGLCANDDTVGTQRLFCFAACDVDADCSVDGRTGYCDNTSAVTLPPYPPTTLDGCRPGCSGDATCAAYSASLSCRMLLTSTSLLTRVRATCGNALGAGGPGESCSLSGDCRSGYCWRRDARGQTRPGICTAPCADDGACAAPLSDGGTSGLSSCLATTLNHSAGPDATANTADDRDAVANVCAPPVCSENADCPLPFPVCAPDASPTSPKSDVVLRCRGAALGSRLGGEVCTNDSECLSGGCAELVPPAVGTGRVCLQPCQPTGAVCGPNLTCRVDAARLLSKDATPRLFTACVP